MDDKELLSTEALEWLYSIGYSKKSHEERQALIKAARIAYPGVERFFEEYKHAVEEENEAYDRWSELSARRAKLESEMEAAVESGYWGDLYAAWLNDQKS